MKRWQFLTRVMPRIKACITMACAVILALFTIFNPGVSHALDVDGFDYPVGEPMAPYSGFGGDGYVSEPNDGDGWYNPNDWTWSSKYGSGHCGEDWNAEDLDDEGDPVYAAAHGTVVASGDFGTGWGNIILIQHTLVGAGHPDYDVMTSQYAHLQDRYVFPGDEVLRGELIGTIGNGTVSPGNPEGYRVYAPHLHFELRWDESQDAIGPGGYGCYNDTSGTIEPSDFIDGHRLWNGGHPDWCTVYGPCDEGEGDCDGDAECLPGLVCDEDSGATYGFHEWIDICVASGGGLPDLEIANVSIDSYSGEAGDSFDITYTRSNLGTVDSGSFELSVRFSENTNITVADDEACNLSLSSMAPGESFVRVAGCTVPAIADGDYYVGIILDPDDVIAEEDEDNNTDYDPGQYTVGSVGLPDLEIANVALSSYSGEVGDDFTISYTRSNYGAADSGLFELSVRFSVNTDITVADDEACRLSISSMAPGESFGRSVTCTVPTVSDGDYYVGIILDPDDLIVEDDESNNTDYDPSTYTVSAAWSCPWSPGDWHYCLDCGPCAEGEGDCDSDSECMSGLYCISNVGGDYGWTWNVDVCQSSSCPWSPGDYAYCRDCGPCAEGEGDCDSDSECMSGLYCVNNVGATYGWAWGVDVCQSSPCPWSPGDYAYCRDCGPCAEGEGDCDGDAECAAGLSCENNVGGYYGWAWGVDVCETP